MTSLHEAMIAVGIDALPAKVKHTPSGFTRWGKNSRFWLIQGNGAAFFGDYTTGESHQWFEDDDKPLDTEQVAARRAKMAALRKQREEAEAQAQEEAAIKALNQWHMLAEAGESPYLHKKQVEAFCVRFDGDSIVVPMRCVEGKLWSLQTINAEGDKRFLYQGRKKGCFHTIGQIDGVVYVAEGYATAASVHMATGTSVVVAFDAGNLEPVIEALKATHPALKIIIAGDDDCWGKGNNTGREAAQALAVKYGCGVLLPEFRNKSTKPTDWNDLHVLEGLEVVREQLTAPPSEPSSSDVLTTVARLALLPPLGYEQVREAEAEALKVRVSTLDKEVEAARKAKHGDNKQASMFAEVEAWPHPVELPALLDDIVALIKRFIVCDKETRITAALWCAFTWVIEHMQVAPIAMITAPEKRCGKSQLLNLMGKLVRNPLVASNISPSAVFRVIEAYTPTLMIDEADTFLKDNEELRGVINSGHTRQSAYVIRNVGDDHEPKQFSTWGAKAISGIGSMPDTVMDRSILLTLRRKLKDEKVERLRHAEKGLFDELASKLARFAEDSGATLGMARPSLPDTLNDRAQDNWEPLLAIADCAGGDWPKIARDAALKLSGAEHDSVSLSAELLADIKEVFETKGAERISTADLIEALCADDEKSWGTYNRGNPISPRQFAKRLNEYGIKSKTVRIDYSTPRGFERKQFEDAFSRYLSSPPSATAQQSRAAAGYNVSGEELFQKQVQHVADCFATENESETGKPAASLVCGIVADKSPLTGKVVEVEM